MFAAASAGRGVRNAGRRPTFEAEDRAGGLRGQIAETESKGENNEN